MSNVPKHDKWIVLGRRRDTDDVHKVWGKKVDGKWKFKHSVDSPGKDYKCRFGKKANAKEAKAWSEKKGRAVYMSKDKYPFLVLYGGVFGKDDLSKKMNQLGTKRKRYLRLGSYKRTQQQQHDLYLAWIRGHGNLAARCNTRYSGEHSWSSCKQYPPCGSNHCPGGACDLSMIRSGRDGSYVNVGNDSKCRSIMKSLNLCLPVGGEPWHTEIGNTWRS